MNAEYQVPEIWAAVLDAYTEYHGNRYSKKTNLKFAMVDACCDYGDKNTGKNFSRVHAAAMYVLAYVRKVAMESQNEALLAEYKEFSRRVIWALSDLRTNMFITNY